MRGSFATLLLFVTLSMAYMPANYDSRWRSPGTVVAMQNPYPWMDTVNYQNGDYTVPTGHLVCELRTTDSCLIKVKLRSRDSIQIRCSSGDILRLDLLKIYKTGSDTLSGFGNKIRVYGVDGN